MKDRFFEEAKLNGGKHYFALHRSGEFKTYDQSLRLVRDTQLTLKAQGHLKDVRVLNIKSSILEGTSNGDYCLVLDMWDDEQLTQVLLRNMTRVTSGKFFWVEIENPILPKNSPHHNPSCIANIPNYVATPLGQKYALTALDSMSGYTVNSNFVGWLMLNDIYRNHWGAVASLEHKLQGIEENILYVDDIFIADRLSSLGCDRSAYEHRATVRTKSKFYYYVKGNNGVWIRRGSVLEKEVSGNGWMAFPTGVSGDGMPMADSGFKTLNHSEFFTSDGKFDIKGDL